MISWALKAVFGTKSQRDIKKLNPTVADINARESELESLSDEALQARSLDLKEKVSAQVDQFYQEYDLNKRKNRDDIDATKRFEEELKKKKQEVLDNVLPEAFALVREAGKRVLNMRHYDVQLMGGIVLHNGKIAEMTTGEGKTLVATLPTYLNALSGRGVHVVTVNDYLAKRDSEWMGPIHEFLGLTIGVIVHDMDSRDRKASYACDITYGTNNEFGFDYLRDNMVVSKDDQSQRPLNYCIVDEVDSILVDEARTPLIISGPVDTVTHCYDDVKSMVRDVVNKQTVLLEGFYKELDQLLAGSDEDALSKSLYVLHRGAPKEPAFLGRIANHPELKRKLESAITSFGSKDMAKDRVALEEKLFYIYDERTREVTLSSQGQELLSHDFPGQFELEDITGIISDIQGNEDLEIEERALAEHEAYKTYETKGRRIRSFEQLLKAYVLFHLDVDYVVQDDKVVIVDEFTGRMMPGRRFSDGLHEALEAKENVKIQRESQTLATITFQNYFRMYHKLAGMTGTADTEASEFHEIYKLDVVVIPTHRPMQRKNYTDVIYKTSQERFEAVVKEIEQRHRNGQPVLVGTVSIERSEKVAQLLSAKNIIHEVLNAKNHEREADIISLAGQSGSVTIATNMAGRGTDIVLGEGVSEKGGLHVIGTERHESRRVDNQLRGRSGRQGDPGSSRFYLSLEDDLMRIFGSDRIARVMERLKMDDGEAIENPLVTRAIETAQKRVEGHNFDMRKWLIKYDNVMNKQREVVYDFRQMILEEENLVEHINDLAEEMIADDVYNYHHSLVELNEESWEDFCKQLTEEFRLVIAPEDIENLKNEDKVEYVFNRFKKELGRKTEALDVDDVLRYMRFRLLETLDNYWKEHLYVMDELRESVGLRAYGQVDPLYEYQKEGHKIFVQMIARMKREALSEVMSMPMIHVTDDIMEELKMNISSMSHPEAKDAVLTEAPVSSDSTSALDKAALSSYVMPEINQQASRPVVNHQDKIGRNDPCSCGSGKKYKKCCGR